MASNVKRPSASLPSRRAATPSHTSIASAGPLMPTQRIREQQRGRDAGRVVAGRLHRLCELVVPARLAGAELGQTELEQQARPRLRRWRLGQGPA